MSRRPPGLSVAKALPGFLQYKSAEALSPRTLESYRQQLADLSLKCLVNPFEVVLPEGLPISGAVLSDQVKSLDWRIRNAELICQLPTETCDEILQKLSALRV